MIRGSNMKFCEKCGNVLLPKKNKSVLFCKVCNKEISISDPKEDLTEYKRRNQNKKKIETKKALKTAIIRENENKELITEEERDAYEDLFEVSEDFSGDD